MTGGYPEIKKRSVTLIYPKTADELETPASAAECTVQHADAARDRMMKRNRDAASGKIANSVTREDVGRR